MEILTVRSETKKQWFPPPSTGYAIQCLLVRARLDFLRLMDCDVPDVAHQGDDVTSPVTYSSFETKMLEVMASRAWDPDPPEVLLRVINHKLSRSLQL